jgi:hypothetical protein
VALRGVKYSSVSCVGNRVSDVESESGSDSETDSGLDTESEPRTHVTVRICHGIAFCF